MPIVMTTVAEKLSTYIVQCTFTEAGGGGTTVVPISIYWTLTDQWGVTINGRSSVAVAVPASVVNIVMKGTDLQIGESFPADVWRFLTMSVTYDSDTYGSGLSLRDQVKFKVANLTSIT